MKIAAVTKFKHGGIYELLNKLGWSQSELARRSGVHISSIGLIINMRRRPAPELMARIQKAFTDAGEIVDVSSMFPDSYTGLGMVGSVHAVQYADMEPEMLADYARHQQLVLEDREMPVASSHLDSEAALAAFDVVLNEKEKSVLRQRFVEDLSVEEIAEVIGVTPQMIWIHIKNGLRKVRDYLSSTQEQKHPMLRHDPDGIWRVPTSPLPQKEEAQ